VSDTELIRRFVDARDESAFRMLYARHTPAVYGLLRRLAGRAVSDADDALQDAWLRAAVNLAGFRGDSTFRTWLTGIALNCLRERRRRVQQVNADGDVDQLDVRTTRADRSLDVADVLETMSAMHRDVLVLHDVEGYTHEEISDVLGIEIGTSKSRLSRARQLFRERWRGAPAAKESRT